MNGLVIKILIYGHIYMNGCKNSLYKLRENKQGRIDEDIGEHYALE